MFVFHYAIFSLLTGFTGLKTIMSLLSLLNKGILFLIFATFVGEIIVSKSYDPNLIGALYDFVAIVVTFYGWK